ncbi:TraR/DksA family transcriptional regulator [Acidiphilium sp.]|uniref:TraR/DksA family transcriptional regulator n=1 Tax=Acidiphilium sp. TaxID=527 RepID=UPI003CFF939B
MNEDEAAAIRQRLADMRAALNTASADAADSRAPVELDQTSVGRLSRIDAMQAQSMALATERRRAIELARIDQALARVAAGTYGICVKCDEPIEPRRLTLDPAIAVCLACARDHV